MNGKNDVMAQAVYLAQIEAAKGACKCKVCQLMRKGSSAMVTQFLGKTPAAAAAPGIGEADLLNPGEEES